MKILWLLLVLGYVRRSLLDQTPQPLFNPFAVDRYKDSETEDLKKVRRWNATYPGIRYTGFLFAGHAEFPWVVHIRDDLDQAGGSNFYSIGNLVSNRHVLTTCRAVTHFNCVGPRDLRCQDESGCPCPVDQSSQRHPFIETNDVNTLYVFYFPVNYYHESMVHGASGDYVIAPYGLVHGRVGVSDTIIHPKCFWDKQLFYDMAVVILKTPLPSMNMWLGVIQVPIKGKLLDDDDRLKYIERRRMICYVASVGYHTTNGLPIASNIINGYKVKYRVYPVEWKRCSEDVKFICRGLGCINYRTFHVDPVSHFRIECWQSRNKIGTICDRDRGAPVVCEGKVEGFVIRGALAKYCNPGIQLPFMMQRITEDYPEFLEGAQVDPSAPLAINPLIPYDDSRRRSEAPVNNPVNVPTILILALLDLIL